MDIYITDEKLEVLTVIDYCRSIIWHSKYCGAGDFELYIPASQYLFGTIHEGCFAYRKDNDTTMIVEKIQLQTTAENEDFIIISGKSAESIIGRRIVWEQTNMYDYVCMMVKQLMNENLIAPTDTARQIPLIKMGDCVSSATKVRKQITGDNLLDAIVNLLSTYGYGFRLTKNIVRLASKLSFEIINGTDRSVNNSGNNPHVKFSYEFDNLLSSDYSADYTDYKNITLVAGEGEGTARKTWVVHTGDGDGFVGEPTGINRREVYTDDSSISSNEGEIDDATYEMMLDERGVEALNETKALTTFTGEIVPNASYKLGEHYFLGDIVTIEHQYGISANVRITDITENLDENGYNVVLTYENI